MNEKSAKKLRKAANGNKTVYRFLKRRWTLMPVTMKFVNARREAKNLHPNLNQA